MNNASLFHDCVNHRGKIEFIAELPYFIGNDGSVTMVDDVFVNMINVVKTTSNLTVTRKPCKNGHVGVKLPTGRCYVCSLSSPRQAAIAAGESLYQPSTECHRCHTKAPRRVDNGACKGCKPKRAPSPRRVAIDAGECWYMSEEPGVLKRVNNGERRTVGYVPDMVISKDDAIIFGFEVYRTEDGAVRSVK